MINNTKKVNSLLILLVVLIGFSCNSNRASKANAPINAQAELNYEVIEHTGSMFGKSAPELISDGVTMAATKLSEKYYPDSYVFTANDTGKDLDGVKLWANNFSVQTELAKRVQTKVESSFNALTTGNKEDLGTALESFSRILTSSEFSGLEKEQDWWFKRRHFKEDRSVDFEDYFYIIVYKIDKKLLDTQIEAIWNQAAEETNLDTQDLKAVDKLNEKIMKDGYGL